MRLPRESVFIKAPERVGETGVEVAEVEVAELVEVVVEEVRLGSER